MKGWKKTKKFSIVPGVDLPDRWDKSLNWLFVARMFDEYGIEVAERYANCMTAGIVARQTAYGYGMIYRKIKDLVTDDFDPKFFELLRCDYYLSCLGLFTFDIVGLDETFGKMDPEYLPAKSLYKNQKCSMKEYVLQKFGPLYVEVINRCNTNLHE